MHHGYLSLLIAAALPAHAATAALHILLSLRKWKNEVQVFFKLTERFHLNSFYKTELSLTLLPGSNERPSHHHHTVKKQQRKKPDQRPLSMCCSPVSSSSTTP